MELARPRAHSACSIVTCESMNTILDANHNVGYGSEATEGVSRRFSDLLLNRSLPYRR